MSSHNTDARQTIERLTLSSYSACVNTENLVIKPGSAQIDVNFVNLKFVYCLHSLLHRLLPDLLLNFDLYWALIPCARGRKKEAVRLSNFLIVSCKFVIYNLYRTSKFVDPLLIFTHRIKNKIIFEHHYFKACQ